VRVVSSALVLAVLLSPSLAFGQDPSGMQMPMPSGHDHQMPGMPEHPLGIDQTRDGSGTSWLPDTSPMLGLMRQRGSWMLMVHGNAFVQYIQSSGDRGDEQFGSINWLMAAAQRDVAGGPLTFRAMFSLEPLTVGRCGYPTLLATGEECRGEPLHDRQHPHDLFMELAAQYRRAISGHLAVEVYGGPVGEPALGPTAFPHRISAMPNPIAPVAHHWLDSTHISFGVVTGGVYGHKWKAETSIFNGREPDDQRYNIDLGALDSYSGRLWIMPTSRLALQVSAGHVKDAEVAADGSPESINRITASLTYHAMVNNRTSATTVAWGQNREPHHATSAFIAETAVDLTRSGTLFARGEILQKSAAELVLPLDDDELFTLSKAQVGYTRWIAEGRTLKVGVGGVVGVSIVPTEIRSFYGGRTPAEFAAYVTIRPQQ